jgi:hypothetical protein
MTTFPPPDPSDVVDDQHPFAADPTIPDPSPLPGQGGADRGTGRSIATIGGLAAAAALGGFLITAARGPDATDRTTTVQSPTTTSSNASVGDEPVPDDDGQPPNWQPGRDGDHLPGGGFVPGGGFDPGGGGRSAPGGSTGIPQPALPGGAPQGSSGGS